MTAACLILSIFLVGAEATQPELPEWTSRDAWKDGDQQHLVVNGGPWSTEPKARQEAMRIAIRKLETLDILPKGRYVTAVLNRPDTVHSLVQREHVEARESARVGRMYLVHLWLRIRPEDQRRIQREASAAETGHWITRATLLGMILLAVWVVMNRLDRYTHRRQTVPLYVAAGIVLAVSACGVWLWV